MMTHKLMALGPAVGAVAVLLAIAGLLTVTLTSPDGTDATPPESVDQAPADSFDLQAAIDSARPGAVIEIPDGTYTGPFRLDNKSQLVVRGSSSAILMAPGRDEILTIAGGSDITLSGFTVQGDYEHIPQRAITLQNVSDVTLTGLLIRDVGFAAVYAYPAANLLVEDSTITHVGDFGVHSKEGSRNVVVRDSTLTGFASRLYPGHALYFQNTQDAVAEGNYISDLPRGTGFDINAIQFDSVTGGRASNNVVERAVAGIGVPSSIDIAIVGNVIRDTYERAIYVFSGADRISVRGNSMEEGVRGIQIIGGTNLRIVDNTTDRVDEPLDLGGGSRDGIVEQSGNSWQD